MLASAARRPPELPEESSARYRLLRRIGSGGMAEVFLAVDGNAQLVVCKRIWPDLAGDPEFIAMFLDEAGLCQRMNHPNVVRTHGAGREGEQYYIAMEYLRGHSLKHVSARLVPQGGMPLQVQLHALCQVLAGLHHAHELTDEQGQPLGIVHRDVSPQNVFVTYDGEVKLVDFGIAKSVAASHRTRPGVLKGRLSYMAPEQIRGGAVDRRADLFSVGVMLWEAAAGRRLWQDMAEAAIVGRLVSGPAISPPLGPGRLPSGLIRVCRRALALDARERYATAAEFQADLLPLLEAPPEELARQLGERVSAAFAEERTAMEAIARRGIEAERSASYELAEMAPPAPPLTDSVLRPVVTAARRERGTMGLARNLGLVVLAGAIGFGTIHLLSRPGAPPPRPVAATPAPAPAVAPTFEPLAAPAAVPAAVPPTPSPIPPPPTLTPPVPAARARPAPTTRRHRVAAVPAARALDDLPALPRPRLKPLDVDNPYQP